jgi:hypothetical protein
LTDDAKGSRAADVYGPLIVTMLGEQAARKASIEQRALAVITSSGALVSLLVALSAVALRNASANHINTASRAFLIVSLVLFVGAATLGLYANAPRSYLDFDDAAVDRMIEEWDNRGDDASRAVSSAHATFLKTAKVLNERKGALLQRAVYAEVAAVAAVAIAVIVDLI